MTNSLCSFTPPRVLGIEALSFMVVPLCANKQDVYLRSYVLHEARGNQMISYRNEAIISSIQRDPSTDGIVPRIRMLKSENS
jgi:hypothetical protein